MAHGTFAVGAGNMDGAELMMRVSCLFAKQERIGEVFFDGGRADAGEHGQTGIKVFERFSVGHLMNIVIKKADNNSKV